MKRAYTAASWGHANDWRAHRIEIRHNGFVPNNFTPSDPTRTRDVDLAVELMGSPARSQILRFIAANPGTYFGGIREAVTDMTANTLVRHLKAMEDAGVIALDIPREERKGRSPRYEVVPSRVKELTDQWLSYLDMGFDPITRHDQ